MSDLVADGGARNLGRRSTRGGAVVLAANGAQNLIQIGILAVLARKLTPEEYGLFALVLVVAAFLQVFQDMGLPTATIQRADLTWAQISTIFWFNLALGGVLAGCAAAVAPWLSLLFDKPHLRGALRELMLWMSLGFVLTALGAQHRALLTRRMAYGRLALASVIGQVCGGGAAIAMAFQGFGVYALVGQNLVLYGVTTCCLWLLSGWVPRLPVRGSGVRQMLRFGGFLAGFNILNYFVRNTDKVLLGYFWPERALGLYNRAYRLMTLPIELVSRPFGSVMLPALSKLQGDQQRFSESYRRALRLQSSLAFPLAAGLGLLSEEAVLLVYGPQWAEVAPLFRLLCLGSLFQAWGNATGWLYVASGQSRAMMRWGMYAAPLYVLAALPVVWWGAQGAAAGYAAMTFGIIIPAVTWHSCRTAQLSIRQVVRAGAGPFLATALMTAVLLALRTMIALPESTMVRAAILAGAGIAAYAVGVAIFAPSLFGEARLMAASLRRQRP